MSALLYHPRYQSRSSMYIRGLIPWNFCGVSLGSSHRFVLVSVSFHFRHVQADGITVTLRLTALSSWTACVTWFLLTLTQITSRKYQHLLIGQNKQRVKINGYMAWDAWDHLLIIQNRWVHGSDHVKMIHYNIPIKSSLTAHVLLTSQTRCIGFGKVLYLCVCEHWMLYLGIALTYREY